MPGSSFERLVELACHDLRTPLATVNGFSKTILRAGELGDPRYMELIDEAAEQMAVLVEQLGLAARIAAGRYDPHLVEANTLELAAASGVAAAGEGAAVETDADTVARSLTALAAAAARFGGAEAAPTWAVSRGSSRWRPLPRRGAAPSTDPRRRTSARSSRAARSARLGGSVELDGESLRVRLQLNGGRSPAASAPGS